MSKTRDKRNLIPSGAAVVVIVALAAAFSTAAIANDDASASSACVQKRLPAFGEPMTFRLVPHGVTCDKARRVQRAYEHGIRNGRCPTRICGARFADGWECSTLSAAEEIHSGGLVGGCKKKGASFKVFKSD